MTELHVEKKKNNGWIWIIIILIILGAIAYWLFSGGDTTNTNQAQNADTTQIQQIPVKADTAQTRQAGVVAATTADFSNVAFDAPENKLDEIKDPSIKVRGNDQYSIYDLGGNILFDKGKSVIKPASRIKLKEIAQSINQRYKGNKIAIFGNADSDGGQQMNLDLAKVRAKSVKDVLVNDDNIDASLITTKTFGESKPIAPNKNEATKKINRNVQIVVIKQKQ